jgi:Spy/CpxP family protein refolding chaperone
MSTPPAPPTPPANPPAAPPAPQPPATPPTGQDLAPQQQPATPQPGQQFQGDYDPQRAARLIDNLRGDLKASQQQHNDLVASLTAAGINVGAKPDPAQLQASLTAAQDQTRSALLRAALYETAAEHGANPTALRDSVSFLESAKGIDPSDTAAVVAAAKAAVAANAALAATPAAPAGPPAGPADLGGGNPGAPRQLTEADLATMTPEQIVKAQDDGLLRNLLGG